MINDFKIGDEIIIKKNNELGRVIGIYTDGYIAVEAQWRLLPEELEKVVED